MSVVVKIRYLSNNITIPESFYELRGN